MDADERLEMLAERFLRSPRARRLLSDTRAFSKYNALWLSKADPELHEEIGDMAREFVHGPSPDIVVEGSH
jgi:hypothetical protein